MNTLVASNKLARRKNGQIVFHADNGYGEPLCACKHVLGWSQTEGCVTCKTCINILHNHKPNPLYHSERPWEILRDTIIVNRPYNDPTEFQIIAVVDASECGLEAAKDNARFIVEACNNYERKEKE
jgi:hypothetical protein